MQSKESSVVQEDATNIIQCFHFILHYSLEKSLENPRESFFIFLNLSFHHQNENEMAYLLR